MTPKTHLCPEDQCEQHLYDFLNSAEKSIHFMTFSFTADRIGDLVVKKFKDDGVDVKGVFEKRQKSQWSEYEKLKNAGIPVVYDHNKATMHLKVFVVDNRSVWLGSYNPSKNANTRNDENIVIVHDEKIASKVMGEFWSVYTPS